MIVFKLDGLVKINALGISRQQVDWFQEPRTLTDFELIFTYEPAVFYLNHVRTAIEPGDVLVIPPGTLHYSKQEDRAPAAYEFIHFETNAELQDIDDGSCCDYFAQKLVGDGGDNNDYFMLPESRHDDICLTTIIKMGRLQKDIMKLVGKALRERVSPQMNSSQLAALCVMEILVLLTRCVWKAGAGRQTSKGAGKSPALVQEAVFMMHEQYESLTEIKEVAETLKITPQHLILLFRKHLQTTPLEYLTRLKLDKAKKLLLNANLSIKEVAFNAGFSSPHYFSRIFRQKEGCSPSEFATNVFRNRLG